MRRILSGALVLSLTALALPFEVEGRGRRPGQIPNGSENGCLNCHMSASGGDARNPFGLTVESDFIGVSSEVLWGPELAAIDSDGDGFTNGEELGDPEGTWTPDDPAPEVEVFLPGDPDSHPESVPTAVEESTWGTVKTLVSKLLR